MRHCLVEEEPRFDWSVWGGTVRDPMYDVPSLLRYGPPLPAAAAAEC